MFERACVCLLHVLLLKNKMKHLEDRWRSEDRIRSQSSLFEAGSFIRCSLLCSPGQPALKSAGILLFFLSFHRSTGITDSLHIQPYVGSGNLKSGPHRAGAVPTEPSNSPRKEPISHSD